MPPVWMNTIVAQRVAIRACARRPPRHCDAFKICRGYAGPGYGIATPGMPASFDCCNSSSAAAA
jgi:hypothetical protein